MSKQLKIEYLPLDKIREYENNPRDNKKAVDAVARSIQEFGIRAPAIIDKNNVLLAGHTRVQAARKLGLKEYPCVRADNLTEKDAQAYRLIDNRAGEDSEWDMNLLRGEFKSLKENGFDLTITGFEPFELDNITFGEEASAAVGQDFTDEGFEGYEPETDLPREQGGYTDGDAQVFVCIICTLTDEEREFVKDLVREESTLKTRYMLEEIAEKMEAARA